MENNPGRDHVMTRQSTVRLPEDLADDAEAVARVKGTRVKALIVDVPKAESDRVRQDENVTSRAERLLERDRELLERLAQVTLYLTPSAQLSLLSSCTAFHPWPTVQPAGGTSGKRSGVL